MVKDEDIASASLYDAGVSMSMLLPKLAGYTNQTHTFHKMAVNARVHRSDDAITPIANPQNEEIPSGYPKTLHELEEMHEDVVGSLEKYYGLQHNKKAHMSDRRRQIRHFLGIYNID